MRPTRTARIVLGALAAVTVVAGVASAQTAAPSGAPSADQPRTDIQIGGLNLEGYGEAGVRFFPQKPSESQEGKFMEYRDLNTGLWLETLRLRLFTPDEKYSFEVGGRDWGLKTMEYNMSATRTGLWEAGFDWDQMRQIFSTNARMLETESRDGVFTLPNPRPPLGAYNQLPFADEIAVQWNTAHMFFKLMPTPESDVLAEYTRIRKDGDIPMGMAFGSPGNNFLEVLQPIDQTIHEFKLKGSWAKEKWQLQFVYTLSVFENDLTYMRADNPCAATTAPPAAPGSLAPCSSGDLGGPQFGTTSLPPNNMANTLNLSGGVNLPLRTRLNANLGYSFWHQNADFLPQTSTNGLPASIPSVMLPQRSLHGNVQNLLFNLTVTSRPLPLPVTFTAKYRYYNMMDYSNTPTFSAFLVNDSSTATQDPTRAARFDYMRQGATVDARWRIASPLAFTTGVGWDQWNRSNTREVPQSNELSAKAALDWTPTDWALIRATYAPAFRRINKYCTICLAGQENSAEPGEQGQSYLLRKFDEGDRNQQSATLTIQLTPIDALSVTPALNYTIDDYISSGLFNNSSYQGPAEGNVLLGVQQVVSWSAGMDVNWKPSDRIVVNGGYMYESRFEKMRSRSRSSSVDVPALDWLSDITDSINTVHFSTLARLVPGTLDLKLTANYSYALGTVSSRNPNATNSAVFTSPANFPTDKAQRFPAYTDGLLAIGGSLRYHFWKNWTASLNYAYEQWRKTNWQTDTLNPFEPGVSSIWLGNNAKNYEAQILSFNLGYRFR
jgi:MtrB/PioB family decaheme-associated outer membrane protein